MSDEQKNCRALAWRRTLWQATRRAVLSVLFTAILVIPRIGRLRRLVWAWTAIRLAGVLAGLWLSWRFVHRGAGAGFLVLGLSLVAIGILARAHAETKSLDAQARELNALVVLNGGTFIPARDGDASRGVRIFVSPEQLYVLDSGHRLLLAIPVVQVRQLAARAISPEPTDRGSGAAWQLEITWESGEVHKAAFRFEGFFAEHLARVAEISLRSVMREGLPVLPA